jgi:hypothetical protein
VDAGAKRLPSCDEFMAGSLGGVSRRFFADALAHARMPHSLTAVYSVRWRHEHCDVLITVYLRILTLSIL